MLQGSPAWGWRDRWLVERGPAPLLCPDSSATLPRLAPALPPSRRGGADCGCGGCGGPLPRGASGLPHRCARARRLPPGWPRTVSRTMARVLRSPAPSHSTTALLHRNLSLAAGIDTFECAATFARKTKKFTAAPELSIPEDLADFVPGEAAETQKAAKGGWAGFADRPVASCGVEVKAGRARASPLPPCQLPAAPCNPARAGKAPVEDKGKGRVFSGGAQAAGAGASSSVATKVFPGDDGVALATMDIFAGCGGLSEGMHQAGACATGRLARDGRISQPHGGAAAWPAGSPPRPAPRTRRRRGHQVGH